jgi:hypothetical protein
MKIVGCDLHAKQQTIAMVDTGTGEFIEKTQIRLRFESGYGTDLSYQIMASRNKVVLRQAGDGTASKSRS